MGPYALTGRPGPPETPMALTRDSHNSYPEDSYAVDQSSCPMGPCGSYRGVLQLLSGKLLPRRPEFLSQGSRGSYHRVPQLLPGRSALVSHGYRDHWGVPWLLPRRPTTPTQKTPIWRSQFMSYRAKITRESHDSYQGDWHLCPM